MNAVYETVGDGVIAVDTEYLRPRADAAHLLVDSGHAAFIDVGTHFSLPNLLTALAAQHLGPDAVDYILLTHIHLDHAGGAGELAALLPRARVLVHPRGIAHLIDPTVLIAATKAVYGEIQYAELYGEIRAIPAERVEPVADGRRITLGTRTLEILHTPGHALHHVSFVDRERREIFTGDTFGVSYRETDTAAGAFILPTTSPSQFDPQQLHASIDRLLACAPECAYLTHYSRVNEVAKLGRQLHADIDAFVRIAHSVADASDRAARIEPLMFEYLSQRLDEHGFSDDVSVRHDVLDGDIALNAAGLHSWLSRRAA